MNDHLILSYFVIFFEIYIYELHYHRSNPKAVWLMRILIA